MRAIAAGDSLAATETAKVLDNDRKTRVAISVKPERAAHAVFELEPALVIEDAQADIEIELGVENANGPSRWRISTTATETELLAPANLAAIARKEDAQRTTAERQQLAAFRVAQQPQYRALSDELTRFKKQLAEADG